MLLKSLKLTSSIPRELLLLCLDVFHFDVSLTEQKFCVGEQEFYLEPCEVREGRAVVALNFLIKREDFEQLERRFEFFILTKGIEPSFFNFCFGDSVVTMKDRDNHEWSFCLEN